MAVSPRRDNYFRSAVSKHIISINEGRIFGGVGSMVEYEVDRGKSRKRMQLRESA
jgi:hypothetical protein